ncbi:S8 family serine peptidase [Deinococcus peraridilitoris]|uniref:Subtilisin-like serine protease n=1 Tax=Deinococcus peraridilitoris (strain DSM 19664 / LMG 22246 / CIP 109416 / KR-200) TaxID=937777 RepID=L0A5E3_DEIPD|nr:S8 family serine peptidase [Deinococcus peraridilitoris]AFZ69088.1 subtilisin-like serine protease [Deinococcus peraridilitoris DSM 19664]
MNCKLSVVVLSTTLLLASCGQQSNKQVAAQDSAARADTLSNKGGKKKIVEPTPTTPPPSECMALYSSPSANTATTNAVIDPSIDYNGEVGTLILSFNFDDAVSPAVDFVSSKLNIKLGDGLGAFGELPMIALQAPITRELVDTLKTNLQQYGLLSIYQDRPLQYFLDQSIAYIKADAARTAFKTTGKGVGVAVIDSGIDGTHGDFPNLVKNIKIAAPIIAPGLAGALYVDTPNSDLTSGHGTHVASTIAGSGTQSGGKYKGVAPGASLVGVGAGDAISILYALQGFDYVFRPDVRETYNVRIISNSWGTSGSNFAPFNPISIASKRAYDFGMIVNFAAGNSGPRENTLNPYSASPCVISVGAGHAKNTLTATNPRVRKGVPGELANFSSRGIPGDQYHHPDIVLPGVNIVAARAISGPIVDPYLGMDGTSPEPMYSSISGTSMATPHMSGVTALMLEVNPSLNLDGVLAAVTSTADPMFTVTGERRQLEVWEVGAGYANAYAAVEKAASTAGSRTTVQSSALDSWSGTVGTTVDGTPVAGEDNHNVTVPSGASALKIKTDWGNPAYDLDLYVYDPAGKLIASSAQGASVSEEVVIPTPAEGTYRVQLKGWLNPTTQYKGSAELEKIVALQ